MTAKALESFKIWRAQYFPAYTSYVVTPPTQSEKEEAMRMFKQSF